MRGSVPLKFRNPLLITFLFNFNIIKDGYQKLTFTHFPLLISVFYVLFSIYLQPVSVLTSIIFCSLPSICHLTILSQTIPPFEHSTSDDNHISGDAERVRYLIQKYKSQYCGKYNLAIVKYRYLLCWSFLISRRDAELSACCRKTGTKQAYNLLPRHRRMIHYDKRQCHDAREH